MMNTKLYKLANKVTRVRLDREEHELNTGLYLCGRDKVETMGICCRDHWKTRTLSYNVKQLLVPKFLHRIYCYRV